VEYIDKRGQFRARRIERSGAKSAPITVAGVSGSRSSGYPRVALHDDELVFAWAENLPGSEDDFTAMQVKTATARLR
jgi:hypothetical protein